jgi:hypothetical protein
MWMPSRHCLAPYRIHHALKLNTQVLSTVNHLPTSQIKWESLLFWGTEHGWTTAGQTDRSDTDSGEAGAACHATPSTHTLLLSAIVELTSTGEGGASDAATDLPPDAVRQICSIDGVTSAAMWACGPCPIPVTVVPICDLTTERENVSVSACTRPLTRTIPISVALIIRDHASPPVHIARLSDRTCHFPTAVDSQGITRLRDGCCARCVVAVRIPCHTKCHTTYTRTGPPGALSPHLVGDLRKRVHHRIAEAEAALKKSGSTLSLGTDEFAFYEMASRGR